jgi:hypothetical protein
MISGDLCGCDPHKSPLIAADMTSGMLGEAARPIFPPVAGREGQPGSGRRRRTRPDTLTPAADAR